MANVNISGAGGSTPINRVGGSSGASQPNKVYTAKAAQLVANMNARVGGLANAAVQAAINLK